MEVPLFSISIICKNEEQSLPNLLNSLKEFIESQGEIVVIDTGSTDNTINILKERGFHNDGLLKYEEVGERFIFNINQEMADEIHREFLVELDAPFVEINKKVFHFCEARKYAGKQCSNDWILSVDCDEVFSALNIQFLNHIIRTGDVDQLNFTFRYKKSDGTNNSITSRDKFYNRTIADWKYSMHEQVKALPGKHSRMCNIAENTLAIDHYQHEAEHRSNYLTGMCLDVSLNRKNDDINSSHVFWLGRDFFYRNRYRSAIKLLKYHNETFKQAWSGEKCMSSIYIGECHLNLDNDREALNWFFDATIQEPEFREGWLKLAEFFFVRDKWLQAAQFANAAMLITKVHQNYMNDGSCYGSKPHQIFYKSLNNLGYKKEAHSIFIKCVSQYPSDLELLKDEELFK
jgi:glycosyltransferase involved in cell wall biosynthesis